MKTKTGIQVRIPQIRKVRTVYDEDGKQFIRMNSAWWEINEYKMFLKDKYAINISYEFMGV